MEIKVTPAEVTVGALWPDQVQTAVDAIVKDGYVIVSNAVPHDILDLLRERMEADSQELIAREKWGGAGQVKGHLQQAPPPFAPYVQRDIVANPFAIQVTYAVLGDGLYNRFYNGNCNTPGSETQPLHADGPHLWPDLPIAHPPVTLVVNICLVAATEENGATEIWPGTHRIPYLPRAISAAQEAARREIVPPVRAVTPKGALVIRDLRMWHRGVPNHSDHVRHMLATVHQVGWMHRDRTLLYHLDSADQFPDGPLDHNAKFVDQPLDYLYERYATIRQA